MSRNVVGGLALASCILVATRDRGALAGFVAQKNEPAHVGLVRQLGASSYAERDAAAKRLLELGLEAKPALIRGMEDDDLEIRLGSHRILIQLIQKDFDARIAAFLDDTNPAASGDVPGWQRFREEVDDGRGSRELFADMLRAEAELLSALDKEHERLEQMCADRILTLASTRGIVVPSPRRSVSDASLAAILFAAAEVNKRRPSTAIPRAPSQLTSRLYSTLLQPATRESLLHHAQSSVLRKLLITWIDGVSQAKEPNGRVYAVQLVLHYDLKEEGARVARAVLANFDGNSHSVPYAAIALARFGTAEDAKHLLPHLDATQVFHTWSNPQLKKEPIRIQVRDAVLAMLIRMQGEDPASYGFRLLEPDDHTVYRIYTLGFLEDSERDAALTKWKSRPRVAERNDSAGARGLTPQER